MCRLYIDTDLQNAFFEGSIQGVKVINLFVWNFYGELIHAAINYHGSWHDSKRAGVSWLEYPKLSDEMTPPGFAILGDSAFVNNTSTTKGNVLRARKSIVKCKQIVCLQQHVVGWNSTRCALLSLCETVNCIHKSRAYAATETERYTAPLFPIRFHTVAKWRSGYFRMHPV